MKSIIRRLVSKSKLINILYRFVIKGSTQRSILESERRKLVDIFDFKTLARPIEKNNHFLPIENNLYGTGQLLNHFAELDIDSCVIEHGFILGSFVSDEKARSWIPRLITFSEYRKSFLTAKTNKEVICVGPYIHYFQSLLNDIDLQNLKNQLGSVLLVFPSHSLNDLNVNYNKKEFHDKIVEMAREYDTVLICLYWSDILKGEFKEYAGSNFKIVTAGHINDMFFLNRLRTFFELSDFVFSNSVGTHIGYSIYLKKPVYLLRQNILYETINKYSNELKQRNEADNISKDVLIDKIYKLFGDEKNRRITDEQFDFISDLFGFKNVNS